MDPRSLDPRRAGAIVLHALLSALVATTLSFGSLSAAAPFGVLSQGALPLPGATAPPDTTYDGFIFLRTDPKPACMLQPVSIVFEACRCNVELQYADISPQGAIRVRAIVYPDHVCAQCDPRALSVPVGVLAAGHFQFTIERVLTYVRADSSVDSSTTHTWFEFDVLPDCVPPTGIHYLQDVRVGSPGPCPECIQQACAGDSIPVLLRGAFPNPCLRLKEVRVVPSPVMSPLPAPPSLEIAYGWNSCIDVACPTVLTPWEARLELPPLPVHPTDAPYTLYLRGVLEDDCGAIVPQPQGQGSETFLVTAAACSTGTTRCFRAFFPHAPGQACDAFVGGGKPAQVTLHLLSNPALAGLQGVFRLDSPALEIVNVEAVGFASHMTVQWTREGNGARFVLFSPNGTPIVDPRDVYPPLPMPIVRVTVLPNPLADAPLPQVAHVSAEELLASDASGQGVPDCLDFFRDRYEDPRARICAHSACDHNGDGHADVRDLVLLVRCVQGLGACPDPITSLDCHSDGRLDLDDVLCCARVVLGLPPADSLSGRPEPLVTLLLDPPVTADDGTLEVPLRLGGAGRVGAARLELTYPSSRYEVDRIVAPAGGEWLALSDTDADRIVLALVGVTSEPSTGEGQERWTVRLRLRDGQAPGGAIALTSAQFSGHDGVGLSTSVAPQSVPLGAAGTLALSAPRPNPFAARTDFTVHLAAPAEVEIAVFDLVGRRVATVHRGPAPAGVNDFAWRGLRDDGTRAPGGIYFVRVVSGAVESGRKVLFVPGD